MVVLPIILVVGVLLVCGLLVARMFEKKREEAYAQAAASLGIEFLNKAEGPLRQLVGQVPMFSKGHGHRFRYVMRATVADLDVYLARVQYRTGSGKNQSTHSVSVGAFDMTNDRTPNFELRPENSFMHKLASFFGQHDIDFEGDRLFSDSFVLKGENEMAVRDYFTEERRRHLVEQDPKPTVESYGTWLILLEESQKRQKPEQIAARIEQAFIAVEPLL